MLNLSVLKNVTTGSPPAASEASVKGKQLLHGRTKARVESLRAELATAVLAVNEAERAVGERLVEELDVTVATDTMKQASDRVRVLESALGVAIQKDEAAETALKDAGWAVKLDAESDALAQLKAVAVRGDRIMGELESLVREEFTPALAAAYAATAACGRSEGQTAFLHAFRQAFVLCVNRACTPYIPDARAGLPAFKDRTWSSWISEQDRMGMTSYAQAKPIPGWQSGE